MSENTTPATPKKAKKAPVEPTACFCGCGTMTKGRFAPGHDARFHGLAKKVARNELVLHVQLAALPHDAARDEFERHVAAELPKAAEKAAADERKKAEREVKAAERKAAAEAKKAAKEAEKAAKEEATVEAV